MIFSPFGPVPPDNTSYDATTWDGSFRGATKDAIRDQIESLIGGGGVSWFALVDKTISSGSITVAPSQRNISLIGEGDLADTLTNISGASNGQMVTLWRKAGVGYSITIDNSGNFHLQNDQSFILNTDHDNITLIHEGSNIWVEQGGRTNAD